MITLIVVKDIQEVTKMTATSTTSSNETSDPASSEADSDLKRKKKRKTFPGREQKEKEAKLSGKSCF